MKFVRKYSKYDVDISFRKVRTCLFEELLDLSYFGIRKSVVNSEIVWIPIFAC